MPVQSTDILFYQSASITGGRMGTVQVPANTKGSFFPDVSQAGRSNGQTDFFKQFVKIANSNGVSLTNSKIFLAFPTTGGDRVTCFPGSQTNLVSNLTGSERQYGVGTLNAGISAGATSLQVTVQAASDAIFQAGDTIRLSNQPSVSSSTGTEEFLTLASSGGVSWAGNVATLTLAAGQSTTYAYLANVTMVSSCIPAGTIVASWGNWGGSTSAGTYDGYSTATPPTIHVPVVSAIGGIYQNWTFTFTSSTAFNCVGDSVGSVGTGTISADFAPNNPSFSVPYFIVPSAGWGGSWQAGDILTVTTYPAAYPVWLKRITPAGCGSLAGDGTTLAIQGGSGA